jgi:hypothetical protein
MKPEARQVLENIIKKLDEDNKPPDEGSWMAHVQNKPDEESLKQTCIYIGIIMSAQEGTENAIGKILVGENILTPALTHKGWKFWKSLPVTQEEKKAIDAAIIRWANQKVARMESLQNSIEGSSNNDLLNQVISMASLLDITSSCRKQLSDDLKKILGLA